MTPDTVGRKVAIVTQRAVVRTPANAAFYEFEDLVATWEDADMVPLRSYHTHPSFRVRRRLYQLLRVLQAPTGLATAPLQLARKPPSLPEQRYAIGLVVASTAFDACTLAQVANLRARCDRIVVYIAETWPSKLRSKALQAEPWDLVDLVAVGVPASAEKLAASVSCPVISLPLGVDSLAFASDINNARPVTAFNPGRRAPRQHQQLLNFCVQRGLWYLFDTFDGDLRVSAVDHRRAYRETVKRSQMVICNPAKFDQPEVIEQIRAVPNRFLEAVAAGCKVVGESPAADQLAAFGLGDVPVVPLGCAPTDQDVLQAMAIQWCSADRRAAQEIAQKTLDWVYRWNTILDWFGLAPSVAATRRLRQLGSPLISVAS